MRCYNNCWPKISNEPLTLVHHSQLSVDNVKKTYLTLRGQLTKTNAGNPITGKTRVRRGRVTFCERLRPLADFPSSST
ncbi:hypothetical protein OUZ56_033306 [Daphnia magna]|uniref:Uncharacterized protein n=1 Tax=Daphnia magna TaxID=35525 RepID=A0ABR0BAK8_9CRUS|nr:hypothetical protein OUZ56_033306 [Daphnia magna]